MKLLSFDIEISDIFDLEPYEDMEKYAPFHISVAATAVHNGEEYYWHSEDEDGKPTLNIDKRMANELLEYLRDMQNKGYMISAWNGLGFDLKWIGHNAQDLELAAKIALKSYDPMFQFFNQRGFPVKLQKVADAMNISLSKTMDGSDAPRKWREGCYQEVIDYCLGDCRLTNLVIKAIQREKRICWITGMGLASEEPIRRLKTVEEVINDPGPDQSWMDSPIRKSKFHSWIHG